jgi:hypothetical protein
VSSFQQRERVRGLGIGLILIALVGMPAPALAQGNTSSERAEQLYTEGKRLAADGKYDVACPMFEESQRLEPAIGTQFNLADCLEKTGHAASALTLFREVARVAQMSGKQERQRAAEERITLLERSVARIRVTGPASPSSVEISVRIDGKLVEHDELARGLPVDPGAHVVKVEATGYKPWSTTVTATEAPATAPADVPTDRVLEIAAPALEANAITPALTAPAAPASALRPLGLALAGGGAVGIAVGAIFGLQALSKRSDAGCNGTDCSAASAGSAATLRDAKSAGTVSTIGFVAGGVLAAAGIVLFVVAPRGNASTTRASAQIVPGGTALALEGVF